MFIRDIFAQKKPVLSFEVFPPKKDSGLDNVISAVDELSKMPIDYMSVTYGAGGSNSKNTAYIASHLKNNLSIPSLAHLTCVANSKDDIKVKLQEYKDLGIENILALRGDKPKDYDGEIFPGYHYANELVEAIKDFGDFCVGGACYPECHPDSPSLDADIENLKVKVIYTDEEIEIFDRLIYAIGGTTPIDFLKACNVKIDENLNPICDGNFESSTKGIYLAGDIASKGEGSISTALNHGYHIIKDISAKNV